MSKEQWKVLIEVAGEAQANSLRGLLEAQGIQVVLSAEGTSHIYGFSIFPLGAIQIIVPADELEQAQQVLDDFESGVFSSSIEDMPEE